MKSFLTIVTLFATQTSLAQEQTEGAAAVDAAKEATTDVTDEISADGGATVGDVAKEEVQEAPPPTPAELKKAKSLYQEGLALYNSEDYVQAVSKFKESFALSRNDLLLYNIALTFDELDDLSESTESKTTESTEPTEPTGEPAKTDGEPKAAVAPTETTKAENSDAARNRLENKQKALFYFKRYLAAADQDAEYRPEATRRTRLLERELRAVSLEANDFNKVVSKFVHNPIEVAPPKQPVDVAVMVPPQSEWVVTLFFRSGGDPNYTAVAMKKRAGELVGRIPAEKVHGSALQYYVEVNTNKGVRINGSGKSASPNVVFVEKDAQSVFYPDFQQEKEPEKNLVAKKSVYPLLDAESTTFETVKWTTTGLAVASLGLSATSFILSKDAHSKLQEQASASGTGCASPPCRAFSPEQRSLEQKGKRFQTIYRVSLGVGAGTAVLAGYLWYRDSKSYKKTKKKVVVAPTFGNEFFGAAALMEF